MKQTWLKQSQHLRKMEVMVKSTTQLKDCKTMQKEEGEIKINNAWNSEGWLQPPQPVASQATVICQRGRALPFISVCFHPVGTPPGRPMRSLKNVCQLDLNVTTETQQMTTSTLSEVVAACIVENLCWSLICPICFNLQETTSVMTLQKCLSWISSDSAVSIFSWLLQTAFWSALAFACSVTEGCRSDLGPFPALQFTMQWRFDDCCWKCCRLEKHRNERTNKVN